MVSHAISYYANPHLTILEPLQKETKMVVGGGGDPHFGFCVDQIHLNWKFTPTVISIH